MIEPTWMDNLSRQGFKYFNQFMIAMWRLGLGGMINFWPAVVGRIMVIQHTGRKSGLLRRTPVNYALVGDDIYCVAGYGEKTDWYCNVLANPQVEIWLPDGWWRGAAEELTGEARHIDLIRQVLVASGFAAYAAGIDPRKMDDEALAGATADYRLVRIHKVAERTGKDGPGELAWIWPLATMVLLPLVFGRSKRCRKR